MIPNPFGAALRLLVLGQTRIFTHPLPRSGDVTIGSDRSCRICIAERGVSPLHVVLRVDHDLVLRNAAGNGETMVGARALGDGEEVALLPGVVVQLGGVAIVVQASAGSARLRHVRSHDYFEGRLEDECARAEAQGTSFAVVRLRFARRQARAVEEAFSRLLRGADLVAMYAADEYELLLGDATPEVAAATCSELVEHVSRAGLGEPQLGFAVWPRDGRSPEALLAAAGQALHGGSEPIQSAVPVAGAVDALGPLLERIAPTTINVLILGETGVGKEVLARRIHQLSPRANNPLVCVNCAALAETLLESELFGYERGAFTGAVQAKPGLLEAAEGGTVLLDEIGEMPHPLQAKLLRVVENRQVTRLGGLTPRSIDVRFLAATNRDLEVEAQRGAFRSDLYFRLNGISLVLPPLRERVREIEPLAQSFLEHFAHQSKRKPPRLSRAALSILERYAWPGNVRELRNVLERAVMLCGGDEIDLAHLPIEKLGRTLPSMPAAEPRPLVIQTAGDAAQGAGSVYTWVAQGRSRSASPGAYAHIEEGSQRPPSDEPPPLKPDEAEDRDRIARALERCAGNQTHAARQLGISRRTLITRIERYALPRPRKREA